MSHSKLSKNYTIIFSCLVISYPVIAHLFMFMGNAYSIGIALLLTSTSLLFFSSWLFDERNNNTLVSFQNFYKVIAANIIIAISIGIHEWTVVMFLTGIFSGLMFNYVSNDKPISLKKLAVYFATTVAFLTLSLFLNKLITLLYQKINHLQSDGYTSNYILWSTEHFFNQLAPFVKNMYTVFFKNFIEGGAVPLWLNVFIYSMILNFLVSIFFAIKNKDLTPIFIAFLIITSAFSLTIITGNPSLELRTYVHLVVPVAAAFMLVVFVNFSIESSIQKTTQSQILVFAQKGMKLATLTIVVLVVLYQTKELNRLFYFEYLRYEADVRTANNIITEIEKQIGSLKKPVVFVGPFKSSANIKMGYVIFDHDRWNIPEKMLSPGRIIGFMRQLGYDMEACTSESDLNKAKEASRKMPSFPKEGSIQELDNFVIVKFGEIDNLASNDKPLSK